MSAPVCPACRERHWMDISCAKAAQTEAFLSTRPSPPTSSKIDPQAEKQLHEIADRLLLHKATLDRLASLSGMQLSECLLTVQMDWLFRIHGLLQNGTMPSTKNSSGSSSSDPQPAPNSTSSIHKDASVADGLVVLRALFRRAETLRQLMHNLSGQELSRLLEEIKQEFLYREMKHSQHLQQTFDTTAQVDFSSPPKDATEEPAGISSANTQSTCEQSRHMSSTEIGSGYSFESENPVQDGGTSLSQQDRQWVETVRPSSPSAE